MRAARALSGGARRGRASAPLGGARYFDIADGVRRGRAAEAHGAVRWAAAGGGARCSAARRAAAVGGARLNAAQCADGTVRRGHAAAARGGALRRMVL